MTLTLDDGGSLTLRVDRTAAGLGVFGEADDDSIRHGRVLLSTAGNDDFAATAAATTFSFAVAASVVTLSGPVHDMSPADATAIAGDELRLVYSYSADDLRGRVLAGNIEVAASIDDLAITAAINVVEAEGRGKITVVLQRQTYPDPDEHELVVTLSAAAESFALGEPSSMTTTFSFLPLPPTVLEVRQAQAQAEDNQYNQGKPGAAGSDAIELGYSFDYAADNRLNRPRAGLVVQVDFELCTDAGSGECNSLPAASMTLTLDDGGSLTLRVDRTAAGLSVFGEADDDSIRHGRVLLSTAGNDDFAATAAATTFSFAVAASVVTLSGPVHDMSPADATAIAGDELSLVYSYSADDLRGRVLTGNIEVAAAIDGLAIVPDIRIAEAKGEITVVLRRQEYPEPDERELAVALSLSATAAGFALGEPSSMTTTFSFLPFPPTVLEVRQAQAQAEDNQYNQGKPGVAGSDAIELGYSFDYAAGNRLNRPRAGLVVQVEFELCTDAGSGECSSLPAASMTLTLDDGGSLTLRVDRTAAGLGVFGEADDDSIRHGRVLLSTAGNDDFAATAAATTFSFAVAASVVTLSGPVHELLPADTTGISGDELSLVYSYSADELRGRVLTGNIEVAAAIDGLAIVPDIRIAEAKGEITVVLRRQEYPEPDEHELAVALSLSAAAAGFALGEPSSMTTKFSFAASVVPEVDDAVVTLSGPVHELLPADTTGISGDELSLVYSYSADELRGRVLTGNIEVAAAIDGLAIVPDIRIAEAKGEITVVLRRQEYPEPDEHELAVALSLSAAAAGFVLGEPSSMATTFSFLPLPPTVLEVRQAQAEAEDNQYNQGKPGAAGSDAIELGYSFDHAAENRLNRPRAGLVVRVDFELCTDAGYGECRSLPAASMTLTLDDGGSLTLRVDRTAAGLSVFGEADDDSIRHGRVLLSTAGNDDFAATAAATTFSFAVAASVVTLSGPVHDMSPAEATAIVGDELSLVYSYSADNLRGRVLAGNIEVAASIDGLAITPDIRILRTEGGIAVVLLRQTYPDPDGHELVVSLSAAAAGFALGEPSSMTTTFSFLPLPPTVLEVRQAQAQAEDNQYNQGKPGAAGSNVIELGYSFDHAAGNRLNRPRAGLVVQVDFELCTDAGYGECSSLPAASMTLTLDDGGSLTLRVDRTAVGLSVFGEADDDSIRHGRVLLSTAGNDDFAATAAATTFSFAVAASVVTLSGPEPAEATAIVGDELSLVYSCSADDLRGRVLAGNIEVAATVDGIPVAHDSRVDGAGGEITVVLLRQTYPDPDGHELVVSLSAAAESFAFGGPSSMTTTFSFLPLPPTVLEVRQAQAEAEDNQYNQGKPGAAGSDVIELGYSFDYAADNRLNRPRAGLVVQVEFELCTDAGSGECRSLPAASMTLTLDDGGSLTLRVDRTAAGLGVFGEADDDSIRHGRVLLSTAGNDDFAATAAATTFSFAVAASVVTLSGPVHDMSPADATAIAGDELRLVYSYSADDLRGRVLAGNIEVAASIDDLAIVPDIRIAEAKGEITVVLRRQEYPEPDEHELAVALSLSAAAAGFALGEPSSMTTKFSFAASVVPEVDDAVVTLSGPVHELLPADTTGISGDELSLVYSYSADDLRGRVLTGNIEVAAAIDGLAIVPDIRIAEAKGEITVVLRRQEYPEPDEHELAVALSLSAAAAGFALGEPSSMTTKFSFAASVVPEVDDAVVTLSGPVHELLPADTTGISGDELSLVYSYSADDLRGRVLTGNIEVAAAIDGLAIVPDIRIAEAKGEITVVLRRQEYPEPDERELAVTLSLSAAAAGFVLGEPSSMTTKFSFAASVVPEVDDAVVTLSGPVHELLPADTTGISGDELSLVYSYSADDLRGRVLTGNIEVAAAIDGLAIVPDIRIAEAKGEITVVLRRQEYPKPDEHELAVALSLSAAAAGFALGEPSSMTTKFSFAASVVPEVDDAVVTLSGPVHELLPADTTGISGDELSLVYSYSADELRGRVLTGNIEVAAAIDGLAIVPDIRIAEAKGEITVVLRRQEYPKPDEHELAVALSLSAAAAGFALGEPSSMTTKFSFAASVVPEVDDAVVTLSGPVHELLPADTTGISGDELSLVYSYSADELRGRVLTGNIEVAAAIDGLAIVPDIRIAEAKGEITVVLRRQEYPEPDEHELAVALSLSAAAAGFALGEPSSMTTTFSFLPLPPTVLEVRQAQAQAENNQYNQGKPGAAGSDVIELGYSFDHVAGNRLNRPRAGLVVQVDFELCTDAGYGECSSLPAASMTLTLDDGGSLTLRVDRTAAGLSVFGEADDNSIRHGRVLLSTAGNDDFAATAAATTFSFAVAASVVTLSGPEPAEATAIVGDELSLVYSCSADDLRGRVLAGNIEVAAAVDGIPVAHDSRVDGAGGEITVVLLRQTYPDPDGHELVVSLSAAAAGFALGEPSSMTTTFSFLPLPPTVLEVRQAQAEDNQYNQGKPGAVGSNAIELGYSFDYAAENRLNRPRAGLVVQVDFELCTDAGSSECSSLPAASTTLTLDDGGSLTLRVDRTAAGLSVFGEADDDSIRHGRVLLSTAGNDDFAATAAATTFSFAVAASVVTLSGPEPAEATAIVGDELSLVYSCSADDLRGRVLAGNIEVAAAVDGVPVAHDSRVDGAGGEITVVLLRQTYPDPDEHELVVTLNAAAAGFALGGPSSMTTTFSFSPLPPTVLEVRQAQAEDNQYNQGKPGAAGSDVIELGYSFDYAADNRLNRPRAGLVVQVDFELCTDAGSGECSSLPAASMTLTLDDGGSLTLRVDRTAAALSVFGEADDDSIRHGRVLLSTAGNDDFAATAAATTFSFAVAAAVVTLGLEGAATAAEGTRVRVSAELTSVATEMTVVRLVVVAGGAGAATDADIGVEGDDFRVVIAAGAALGTTEFTVLDDDVDEGDETLGISIREGEAASDQIIEVTILDNDTRGVEISATTLDLTAGESGIYAVVLTSQPTAGSVEVIPTSSDSARVDIGDITAGSMPSDLVFSPENWNITRTVRVTTFSDPDARHNEVEITHQVVADADVDYAAEVAANIVVRVVAGAAPVFELEETSSVAVFMEKSIPVKFFSDGSGGSSGGPTVMVLEAPDDLAVKFDEDAGDYGAITLRRLSEEPDGNGERSREVKLVVLDGQGGRTVITIDIERLAPLPEIEISEIQSHLLLLPLGQSRPLAASLKGGAVAGVMWRVEVSRGDSVEVSDIDEQGSFTVTASSYKTGESELKLSAFDDNGRRRERSLPVVVLAAEAKPRLKLSAILPDPLDPAKTATVSGFAVTDDIWIEAALEGAVPSIYDSAATLSFRIRIAKLGADGMPEGDVVQLTAAAQVEGGDGAPALRIELVPVGAQMMASLSLKVGDLVQVSIGHLVDGEVSAGVIAGDALLLQVLATAMVDGDNDGLSDAVGGETEPDILGPITAAIVEVTDSGVNLPEGAVTVSLSLGDLARSLGLGGCGGVTMTMTMTLGAADGLTGCGDANLIDRLAIKTLTMAAQEQFGDGDYQLFDFSATFDSSEVDPGEFLVINMPVDPETYRVYRFAAETAMWVPVIGAGLPDQPGIGGQGVLDSTDDCKTCFYALDVDRDGSVELLLLFVPLVPGDPGFAVDPSFQGRRIDIDAGDKVAPTIIPILGLGELTATVTGNAYVEGRYIQMETGGGIVGPAVELRGLKRTRNGPEQVVVEAFDESGEAVATIALYVSVRNQAPEIEFRLLSSGEPTTSIALPPNTETVLVVMILDPDGDTDFALELTGGGDVARLEPGANPTVEVDSVSGGSVVINRLILTSRGASPSFNLTLEATDRIDQSKSSGRLTVCVNDTGKCPAAVGGGGGTGSGSGGGGSLGPWALAALVLPLLLGWWRRRRRLIGGSAGVGNEKKIV